MYSYSHTSDHYLRTSGNGKPPDSLAVFVITQVSSDFWIMDSHLEGHAVYASSEEVYHGLQKAEHGRILHALLEKWLRLLSITASYRFRILLKVRCGYIKL
jgi:hypothetical protein